MRTLSRRDRATLAVLAFFFVMATTVELYFLVAHEHLAESARSNFIARMFEIYAPADRAYFQPVSSLAIALELLNVLVTQPLGLVIMYGIIKKRPWRYPLQLVVGSYLAYSVVLYFLEAQVSGFANMAARTPTNYALFYGANAPWLIGYAWLALDAGRVAVARFATTARVAESAPALEERDGIAPVVEQLRE